MIADRLRVLIVTINYEPEQTGFGPHVGALARSLTSHGHAVTVVTGFPFAPQWRRWPKYRGHWILREETNGVEVIRASHFIPRLPGQLLQRLGMEISFALMATVSLSWSRQPSWNVILYCGAQPGLAMLARLLGWWKRLPYVVSIQDLAAQAATDVGIVRHRILARLMTRFEYAAYRKANSAFVLCEAFRDALVAHGHVADRVHVVRSPIDLDHIRPVAPSTAFRARNGIGAGDFVVLFAGSMGLKQGLANVIEAARKLQGRSNGTKWVLIGEGDRKASLRELIDTYGLGEHVKLLPLQPEEELPAILASADLLLLNQVGRVKTTVVPSKLLTYMAAGKPVLAAVSADSQGAALLREAAGGAVVTPDDPPALAAAVVQMRERPRSDLDEMGRHNRAFAAEHFDSTRIVAFQEEVLMNVVFEMTRREPLRRNAQAST